MNKVPIAIVDCNNFYASCERVFNPKLIGKPILVLSNNDGIIVARSNEAKALGIKMGEPLFKVKDLVAKYDIKVFSSNYMLYGDMSHRVMATLEQFAPEVEIYSIDEAFLNFQGFDRMDLTEYCRYIRKTVYQWTGITVSIGIAETKTLAKLANRIAKKKPEYDGVMNLINCKNIVQHLKFTQVEDIWGVGRQYTKLLTKNGIMNAYDFTQANDKWIRKNMTVMGLRTAIELRGVPCIKLEHAVPAKKAILSSRSFGHPVENIQEIKEAVALFTTRAAEKLRHQNSAARLLTVFMRTNPFKETPQYHNGVLVHLPVPTDSTSEMLFYAMKGIDQIYREGYKFNKVGIMLAGFVPVDRTQIGLFDSENRFKMGVVSDLIDKINLDMGRQTIFYASCGIRRPWQTKAELRSQRFTTKWKELPQVTAGNKPAFPL